MVSLNILNVFELLVTLSWAQYTVDPPTTAPNNTILDCTNWVVVTSSDTCTALAVNNGITLAQFDTYVRYSSHL